MKQSTKINKRRLFAVLMLILLTVIWGGTFPATKLALDEVNPIHFLALRFWLSIILLAPALNRLRRFQFRTNTIDEDDSISKNTKPLFDFRLWKAGVFVGVFLLAGYILQVIGLRHTTASRSGFFTGLLVIIAPIFAHVMRTSRTPASGLIGVPLAVVGVYFMSDPELGGLNTGDFLTIACAVAFSAQMVALESVAWRIKDAWGLTFVQNVTVAAGALIWSLVEGIPFSITPALWVAVGYTAIFGSVAAGYLQTRFQPETTAGHASLIFTLEPVFASLFAWLLLGDSWTIRGIFGAMLILVAMGWSSLALLKQKPQ